MAVEIDLTDNFSKTRLSNVSIVQKLMSRMMNKVEFDSLFLNGKDWHISVCSDQKKRNTIFVLSMLLPSNLESN